MTSPSSCSSCAETSTPCGPNRKRSRTSGRSSAICVFNVSSRLALSRARRRFPTTRFRQALITSSAVVRRTACFTGHRITRTSGFVARIAGARVFGLLTTSGIGMSSCTVHPTARQSDAASAAASGEALGHEGRAHFFPDRRLMCWMSSGFMPRVLRSDSKRPASSFRLLTPRAASWLTA